MFTIQKSLLDKIKGQLTDCELKPCLADVAISCSYTCHGGGCDNFCTGDCYYHCQGGCKNHNDGW